MPRKVYISEITNSNWLTPQQQELTEVVIQKIVATGFAPQRFFKTGDAASLNWSFDNVEKVMRNCVGWAVIAFPRWQTENGFIASEFINYEGAVAHSLKLPMLTLLDKRIQRRGVFSESGGNYICAIPDQVTPAWLESPDFCRQFQDWTKKIEQRFDLFFGYSTEASETASQIYHYLTSVLGLTVLDWKVNFRPARFILDEIQHAASISSGGIFLFTKDDKLEGTETKAAPRDNVILEAGMFIQAKGKNKVLIVREAGAQMPADLGGDIYLLLENRNYIKPVEEDIKKFVLGSL
jgi:hypothetical protein